MDLDEEIANLDKYNRNMRQSLQDKLFFVDKIDPDVIVDYGCADGSMIETLAKEYPDTALIGYDIDPKMVKQANAKNIPNTAFTTNWSAIEETTSKLGTSVIILSSVIHEVYAYSTSDETIVEFWKRVFTFDYVVIRDMIPSEDADRPSDPEDVAKVRETADPKYLKSFEEHWGSIDDNLNLIHYLLKYKYIHNWDREVEENYLPLTREELLQMIPSDYEIMYQEHYILPYTAKVIENEFDIVLKDDTYLKLILRKRT